MNERRPIWKHRTSFSKDRNVAVVLWPKGSWEGHETPPSITLEEGRREGEKWKNKRISLTLDKTSNIILDLQVAYARALDLLMEEPQGEAGTPAKPVDPIAYLKESILKNMVADKVYPRDEIVNLVKSKHEWAKVMQIERAVSGLTEEGKLKPKLDNLILVGFRKT